MFRKNRTAGTVGALAAVSLMMALPSAPAFAADEMMEEIVVTGSRIRRNDLTANSPIAIFNEESIDLANTANLEEFLRDMPQFVAGVGAQGNNGNPGVATLDLRNLGEERTLVLLDGKRLTPYDADNIIDIASIPTALIERVEVITGGASAVYGTDAIAGVVNFIMKDDFEGIHFDSSYQVTGESDGDRYDANVTFGGNFDGGRGNIVFNFGYTDQEEVTQGDRDFSLVARDDLLNPQGSFTTPAGVFFDAGFPGDPYATADAITFDTNGEIVAFDAATDTFNFNPFNLLQVPQKKWTITTIGHYDITDDVSFFARGTMANSQVDTIIAPSGTFFFPFNLNYATNPFLGPNAVARFAQVDAAETDPTTAGDGIVNIAFGRRLPEVGTRDSLYENTTYQITAGFEGDFGLHHWELFGQFGRTARTQNFRNDVQFDKAQQAMLAVDDGTGNIVCMDPSNNCVPANFFGEGNLSDAAAQFIALNLNENNRTRQRILGGSVTGDLPFELPSATESAAYALGFELRRDESVGLPDGNYSGGNSIGFGSSSPVNASIEVDELFGELRLPIVQGLAVEGGFRTSSYTNEVTGGVSNDFDNTTWKVGAEWEVVQGLRFRAMYQEAVRAPTINEIGFPLTPSTGDLDDDPCDSVGTLPTGALATLCEQTGVPAGRAGQFTSIIAGQINNFIGGNPLLEPEDAETTTFGVVFTPNSIPLEITLDYYEIEITNGISQISEQNVVNACYNVEQDPNGMFCSLIARNTLTGALVGGNDVGVNVQLQNAAFENSKGIDFTARYGFQLGDMGELDLSIQGVNQLETQVQDASFLDVNDCVGLVGNTCLSPDPEWRWIQTSRWTRDQWTVQLRWQYLGEVTNDSIVLSGTSPSSFAVPTIDSYNYFDLSAVYDLNENWSVRAGILNLSDEDPPVVGNSYGGTLENSGNTYPATYDPLGRSYFVGVNAHF